MSKIKGVNISAPIVPFATNDNYPTHYAKYGNGGYMSVETIEERDSIPEERLEEGMLVFVKKNETGAHFFQYIDGDWTASELGRKINLDYGTDTEFNARIENGSVTVYNELAEERLPLPTKQDQYSNIKINSFYLGNIKEEPNEHDFLPCSHVFIELANVGNEDMPLLGLFIKYTAKEYENSSLVWYTFPLTGVIKAGSTYLVRGPQCSVINAPTTYIKVKQYNQEWNELKSPSLEGAMIYLCWGNENGQIIGENGNIIDNPETDKDITDSVSYVDLACIGDNFVDTEIEDALTNGTGNKIFVRRYPLDPTYIDSKNNEVDWRWHYIQDDTYKPAASYEGKNIIWGNDWFKKDQPTTLTCTVGSRVDAKRGEISAVRCFTWTSTGYEDEYLWIRHRGDNVWQKIVSFSGNTTTEALNNLTTKSEISTGHHIVPLMHIYSESNTLDYYNRVMWETIEGDAVTTHRVLVEIMSEGVYEYYCGRDNNYKTDIREITIYDTTEDMFFNVITIGNLNICNREEANLWNQVSDYLYQNADTSVMLLNTGNIVKNGNRPQEWIYYINNNNLAKHIAEFITPGPNDLGEINLYDLGKEKVNYKMLNMFYTFELDPDNLPLFEDTIMPGLYRTRIINRDIISVNSTIITNMMDEGVDTVRDVMKEEDEIVEDIELGYSTKYYYFTANWLHNSLCDIIERSDLKIDTKNLDIKALTEASFSAADPIIVTNRCPIEPYSYKLDQNRENNTRSADVIYDNLNERFTYYLSRLFNIWKINKVIGQNDWRAEISKCIFDAPLKYDPKQFNPDWKSLLMGEMNKIDTFIPIIIVYTKEEAAALIRSGKWRLFWNGLDTKVYVDDKEFAAYSKNDNPEYTTKDEGYFSIILSESTGQDIEYAPKYVHHQSTLLTFGTQELNASNLSSIDEWFDWTDKRIERNLKLGPNITMIKQYEEKVWASINTLTGLYDSLENRPLNNIWNEEIMNPLVNNVQLIELYNELI